MAAQAGKDLLLKLDDGLGAFITVAGLRTRQLTFNADSVDITSQESSGRWRELLAGAGIRRAGLRLACLCCWRMRGALSSIRMIRAGQQNSALRAGHWRVSAARR